MLSIVLCCLLCCVLSIVLCCVVCYDVVVAVSRPHLEFVEVVFGGFSCEASAVSVRSDEAGGVRDGLADAVVRSS